MNNQRRISFKMFVREKEEHSVPGGMNGFRIRLVGPQYPYELTDPRYGEPVLNGELLLNVPHFMIADRFSVGGECEFSIEPDPFEPTALANSGLTLKKQKPKPLCQKHPNYKALRPPKTNCPDCQKAWNQREQAALKK